MGNCSVPSSSVMAMEGAVLGDVTGEDRKECGGVIRGTGDPEKPLDSKPAISDFWMLLRVLALLSGGASSGL